jgi:uncharacterized protein (DUF697 family)/tellurite resistance protein
MNEQDREPLATIALIAAFADGDRTPEEVETLNRLATEIGGGDFAAIARRVLSGQASLSDIAGKLSSAEAREKAYEMAAAVCHADGVANEKEKTFLKELRTLLSLDATSTSAVDATVGQVAMVGPIGPTIESAGSGAADPTDDMILKNAMLAGALELLPHGLAAMAIVPLQLRLVYRIGADQGQKLDANQIKDLLGAVGIGAAGQVMEGMARRVLGGVARGVLGNLVGGLAGGVAATAGGAALSFATTYALGHAARQYYAQGRRLSRADLQALFAKLKEDARTIFPRVENQIRDQARGLNLQQVLQRLGAR